MRTGQLFCASLLPIEEILDRTKVARLAAAAHRGLVPPALAVPYGYAYLLLDGHHRAAAFTLLGLPTPTTILEHDRDLLGRNDGAFYRRLLTMAAVHYVYEQEWRPNCREAGIESFHDLMLVSRLM